ncbi:hypothetical protein UFOVP1290_541 [uncultured Caudovirales phage]|uniref:Uncharacterized protein n=1 Tax=uncultured Caudovirales phage TaxID=2100421 RepID=A0A6J5RTY5_9CAUD|nr:hypothetical protein UFOVP1290_541 [uncultured Caudovirales phage]
MRGKKIDSEFLSEYITKCIMSGKHSQEEIISEAKKEIDNIDYKIKEVEKLRIVRSKLLDVVCTFDKSKPSHMNDRKILKFFNIKKNVTCKYICDLIKRESIIDCDKLNDDHHSKLDISYCIKQLVEYNILCKSDKYIFAGIVFNEYFEFLSRGIA